MREPKARSDRRSVTPLEGESLLAESKRTAKGYRRNANIRKPAPQALPPIEIRIVPPVHANRLHNRYDLALLGQIESGQPIDMVALNVNGAVVEHIQYSHAHQPTSLISNGDIAFFYTFNLHLQL